MYGYGYTSLQNRNHHEAFENLPKEDIAIQSSTNTTMNPMLPPFRRINNHLPPKNIRMLSSIPRPELSVSNLIRVENQTKLRTKYLDGESVMNLSLSGSGSESEDDTYTDDESEEPTTYSYAHDETPATHFNCMNSLFLPASNDQEMHDTPIIRCHRVGPSSAELQLNIPLPAQYTNHNLPPIEEGERSGYIENVCKAPSLHYNHSQYDPALFEETVVEIDPFKQYRERIAPQFYESLVEEDSEEEDFDDEENENDSVRQQDDSQIFGYLDAQRSAMQEAMYNDIVLRDGFAYPSTTQSPPSQIFVKEPNLNPPLMNSGPGSQHDANNYIELSTNGSSEVFSRPEDGQDSSLDNHLREAVDVGNVVATIGYKAPKQATMIPATFTPSTHAAPKLLGRSAFMDTGSAPSMDESVHSCGPKTRRPANYEVDAVSPFDQTDSDTGTWNPAAMTMLSPNRQQMPLAGISFELSRPSLVAFPSFDEPGRNSCIHGESEQTIIGQRAEKEKPSLANESTHDPSEWCNLLTKEADDVEGAPNDEALRLSCPGARFHGALNISKDQTQEAESSTDEIDGFLSTRPESPGLSDSSNSTPIVSENISICSEGATVRSPRGGEISYVDTESKVRTSPISNREFQDNPCAQGDNDSVECKVNFQGPTVFDGRFAKRLILEEMSKPNVRSEISEKSGRELRKDRFRTFDQVRPIQAAVTLVSVFEDASIIKSRPKNFDENAQDGQLLPYILDLYGTNTRPPREEEARIAHHAIMDGVHELDDLMEFHSCDEDFFTSHTRSEQ